MKMDWRAKHQEIIHSFLTFLNQQSDQYILKGGTALLMCYQLDRFSEDIDLDGKGRQIAKIIDRFCKYNHYTYRIAKDTKTVMRYMINYGKLGKPLKIEISFRRKVIKEEEFKKINDILVYTIDILAIMKSNAYTSRDKIRDLYDLTFIVNNHFEILSSQTISLIQSAIEYKGIEQFDYIIKEQQDELINKEKLIDDFLLMFERLGLLLENEEKHLLVTNK